MAASRKQFSIIRDEIKLEESFAKARIYEHKLTMAKSRNRFHRPPAVL